MNKHKLNEMHIINCVIFIYFFFVGNKLLSFSRNIIRYFISNWLFKRDILKN